MRRYRIKIAWNDAEGDAWVDRQEMPDGEWVRWADVEAHTRKVAAIFERDIRDRDALAADNARLRSLLTRVEKYATEDRAATPGLTRLARALAEARAMLGVKP